MSLNQDASTHWQAKRGRDDQLWYYLPSLAAGGLALFSGVAMSLDATPALVTLTLFALSLFFGIFTINAIRGAHGIELTLAH